MINRCPPTSDCGAAALVELERRVIDIAFVDYAMLDMNGLQLLEAMQRLVPGIARVMVTAHPRLRS